MLKAHGHRIWSGPFIFGREWLLTKCENHIYGSLGTEMKMLSFFPWYSFPEQWRLKICTQNIKIIQKEYKMKNL